MPPKKQITKPIILKFKRQSQTIFIQIEINKTIKDLKYQLIEIISQTGGLKINNQAVKLHDLNDDDDADGEGADDGDGNNGMMDIEIPKPSFDISDDDDDDDDDGEDDDGDVTKETIVGDLGIVNLTSIEDIKLSLCSSNTIYEGPYDIFDDDDDETTTIEQLQLKDFDTFIFALNDEEFNVYKPIETDK
ncbi:hypothetical protein CANARDRAFT_7510 [[Candida] arabinofermentans NRRL YB-2248]|uniref:Ubiquitin-like domain-containing protein n=1 Tax=[Candida] arabinofermentans NRRL YB-2248 TaxID=983967 RepID=A0A1E4T0V9_9ASCO|nr:hypothetical protein CANARDRAFT_7510 [[Candida] arabinofermentans NRRL YB-2248]